MQACSPLRSPQLAHEAPPLRTLLDFAAWLLVIGERPCDRRGCTVAEVGLPLVEHSACGYLEAELPALAEATRVLQVLCCSASPAALAGPCPVARCMMIISCMYALHQPMRQHAHQ